MKLMLLIELIAHDNQITIVDDDNEDVIIWEGLAEEYSGQIDESIHPIRYFEAMDEGKIIIYVTNTLTE